MKQKWALIAVTLLLAPQVGAAADVHKSIGLVVRIDPAKGTLDIVEKGRHLKLVMGQGAKLLDEEGQPLHGLKAIKVGDFVREECSFQKEGPSTAKKISIILRASDVEGSPEK